MLNLADYVTIFFFLLVILAIGFVRRPRTLEEYWVNDRSTGALLLTLSIIATSAGSGMVFGITSFSFRGGMIGLYIGVFNCIGLLLLAFLCGRIKAFADAGKLHSLPDLLGLRYSRRCRALGAMINMLVYFFFLAAQLIALATIAKTVTGLSYQASLVVGLLVLACYTTIGGLRTDMTTDVAQAVLLGVLVVVGLWMVPRRVDLSGFFRAFPASYYAGTEIGGVPFLVGMLIFFTPVPLVMMDLWLRLYAARSAGTARRSLIIAAVASLPLFAFFTFLGMTAKMVAPNIDPDFATTHMLLTYVPIGLRGLIFAGFFAAIMSTADSMLVVVGITSIKDLHGSFRPANVPPPSTQLRWARRMSVLLAMLAAAFAVLIPSIVQLMINAFSGLMVMLPAILGAIFGKTRSEAAAFWSMLVGFVVTMGLLFIAPQEAFIPGVLLSVGVYLALSWRTRMLNRRSDEDGVGPMEVKSNG